MSCRPTLFTFKRDFPKLDSSFDKDLYNKLMLSKYPYLGEEYLYNYVCEALYGDESNSESIYVSPDMTYVLENEELVSFYPIFRIPDWPDFILKSPEDIKLLQDHVFKGGNLFVFNGEDWKQVSTDYMNDDWIAIKRNLEDLWTVYPDLVIKFI